MTTASVIWIVVATVGPLPFVWVWRRAQAWHRQRRIDAEVRAFMAERARRGYGGAIKTPGRPVKPLDRPQ